MKLTKTYLLVMVFFAITTIKINAQHNPAITTFQNLGSPVSGYAGKEFNNGSVEFWQSYKGDGDVTNQHASLRTGADMDNGNFYRLGDAVYVNYPMYQNYTYTISMKVKVHASWSNPRLERMYVIADKCLPALTNQTSNNWTKNDADLVIPDINNIGSSTKEILATYNNITNTSWVTKTITFTPSKNQDQILIVPYELYNWSQTDTKQYLHIDDVVITGTPRTTQVSLNINPNTYCENDEVWADANGTVDNFGHFAYYVQIWYENQNGQLTGYQQKWTWGSAAQECGNLRLNDFYNQAFTANSDGSTRKYYVKLAVNGNSTNQWYETVKNFYVSDTPDFNFNIMPIHWVGQNATISVNGLPSGGNYNFNWYEGTWVNASNYLGSGSTVTVNSLVAGNFPYTVQISNANNPNCYTTKTIYVKWMKGKYSLEKSKNLDSNLTTSTLSNFKVYPNPSNGKINIELANLGQEIDEATISVIDVMGKEIYNSKINTPQKSILLNNYTPGLYYVIISGTGFNHKSKIMLK